MVVVAKVEEVDIQTLMVEEVDVAPHTQRIALVVTVVTTVVVVMVEIVEIMVVQVSMVVLEIMEVLVPLVRIKMGFGFLEV